MRYSEIMEASLKLQPKQMANFRGNYGAFIITMKPEDFLRLTTAPGDMERIAAAKFPLPPEDYIARGGEEKEIGRFYMPFLYVEWPTGKIKGHEGRHRALMIQRQGGTNLPVVIYLRYENHYSVSYIVYDGDEERTKTEDFGTDKERAYARRTEMEGHNQRVRAAWDNDDFSDLSVYHQVKLDVSRGGWIKGSPTQENPDDPWDRKAFVHEDMPKQLLGQFDRSVVVTDFRIGRVKGYSHFSK